MKKLKELLKPQDYAIIEETYKDYPLDWNKVFDFAYNLDIKNIQFASSYRRGAIIKEIEKGTFIKGKKVEIKKGIINLTNLWNDLRAKKIRILGKSQYFINELEQHLYNNDVELGELYKLNHQIVEYLKEGDDTEYYYDVLKHSKLASKVNIVEFETIAEQEWENCKSMFESMEDPFYKVFES